MNHDNDDDADLSDDIEPISPSKGSLVLEQQH